MLNRLAYTLDRIEREQEAPIYVLERLRWAVCEDKEVRNKEADRLHELDRSGEGRAFGSGWMDFLAFAMKAQVRSH
jgi:hypothetical protein